MLSRLIRQKLSKKLTSCKLDLESSKYIPLYGVWLIDIGLELHWYKPTLPRHWPQIFGDYDFCAMTGMKPIDNPDEDDEDEKPKRLTSARCRKLLIVQRKRLQQMRLPPCSPLSKNIELLTELLNLTDSDQAILIFAVGLSSLIEFREAIGTHAVKVTTHSFCRLLESLTGIKEYEFVRSFAPESPLISSGLIKVRRHTCDLELKISLIEGLEEVMLSPHTNSDELMALFMCRAATPSLTLDNFPHLQKDRKLLSAYLSKALVNKARGVNILLHGKPGVGKNEFVQALAKELNVDLYEVSYADKSGDPIKGEARFQAYALCQSLLARNPNTMLLFDEVEDVFGSGGNLFSMLFGDNDDEQPDSNCSGKAWVNRTLENNPVPAIWISNHVAHIDKAYLRRFDFSVSFPIPPHSVRINIARHHLECFDPPQVWIERLAANENIVPAQFERAAKVARIASPGDNKYALELVEQSLDRSITLLGQNHAPSRNLLRTGYSLEWLNTDILPSTLVEGLKSRPHGTFCFYGAAGTGKSELARYISDQIGKPLVLKRASDIISKWVGDSEKNIAAMFQQARQQDAVLVLDEADSFLTDRRDAHNSWEVTQVNELLTQMEAFEGIFVCTTNLMNKLDQASLRRFTFKVRFDPLKPAQRVALFRQELVRLGGDVSTGPEFEPLVCRLEQLTPGDFAVAARQFEMLGERATSEKLYEVLKKECQAKGGAPRRIGFGA